MTSADFVICPDKTELQTGRIAQYEFYVSTNPVNWGSAVATGTFANTGVEKQVLFSPKTGQYIRLRALSEVNGKPWTSVAELNVLQSGTGVNQAPDGVIDSPAANTTIVVGSAINFTGTGSDPDGTLPLSYRWTFGTGSGIPDSKRWKIPGLVQFNTPGHVHCGTLRSRTPWGSVIPPQARVLLRYKVEPAAFSFHRRTGHFSLWTARRWLVDLMQLRTLLMAMRTPSGILGISKSILTLLRLMRFRSISAPCIA